MSTFVVRTGKRTRQERPGTDSIPAGTKWPVFKSGLARKRCSFRPAQIGNGPGLASLPLFLARIQSPPPTLRLQSGREAACGCRREETARRRTDVDGDSDLFASDVRALRCLLAGNTSSSSFLSSALGFASALGFFVEELREGEGEEEEEVKERAPRRSRCSGSAKAKHWILWQLHPH
uniref:Uncharacterized protein n=1 Tax=Oryza meridionalis TaxID=40149 RepID=A0A0E0CLN4_9ORYZ